jgi:hypothetical protein
MPAFASGSENPKEASKNVRFGPREKIKCEFFYLKIE